MNWKGNKEKCPKAYKAFRDWWLSTELKGMTPMIPFERLPFEMQSGVLEKFFDEQGIYAKVSPTYGGGCFSVLICDSLAWEVLSDANNTRSEAQIAAYTRAFEILNDKLK